MKSGIPEVLAQIDVDLLEGKDVSYLDLYKLYRLIKEWDADVILVLRDRQYVLDLYQEFFSNLPSALAIGEALVVREAFWSYPYTRISDGTSEKQEHPAELFLRRCGSEHVVKLLESTPDFFAREDGHMLARLRKERKLKGAGWFGERTQNLLLDIGVNFARKVAVCP